MGQFDRVFIWAFIISLGGFLFGLDTAVISGCERTIQELWQLSDAAIGQVVAFALYGTIVGAFAGGIPAERWGRKKTLLLAGLLFFISAIGCGLSNGMYSLMFFRFMGGLAIGVSSVVAPMYIAEISPAPRRGFLTALFQFNLVLGILLAYFSNWIIGVDDPENWRWMLGIVGIPSLLLVILIRFVPESPRWLVRKKGNGAEIKKILDVIQPGQAEQLFQEIETEVTNVKTGNSFNAFLKPKYYKPILLVFLFAFFNQVSGINAVIYYAPRIFEDAGLGNQAALLSSVGIGVINLLFTLLGLKLIDTFGRKFLMYVGSLGYILSLGAVALAFGTNHTGSLTIPLLLFVFIASHAIGQGAVIWVFISEIFPNNVRSWGNTLGSATHWVFAALISATFPVLANRFGQAPIFATFAVLMIFQLLFVWKLMPETKGIPLEEIQQKMK